MSPPSDIIRRPAPLSPITTGGPGLPALIARADHRTGQRYLEFFAASIRNRNTRSAYATAAVKFFAWCERAGIHELSGLQRLHVAAYIEELTGLHAAPTVKQNLAALRMLFDYLRVPRDNPAEGVKGPRHVVRKGRTPVLSAPQAKLLLDSIDSGTIVGLRDRALISLMIYTFARVSAAVGVQIEDFHLHGNRRWIRLSEKGGKEHALPLHHQAEDALELYLRTGGLTQARGPLFRAADRHGQLSERAMTRFTAWEMVKRRARSADIPAEVTNHTFRATGITVYLENGGTIENARNIAAHASIKTTQSYDRRDELVTLDEINRIRL